MQVSEERQTQTKDSIAKFVTKDLGNIKIYGG